MSSIRSTVTLVVTDAETNQYQTYTTILVDPQENNLKTLVQDTDDMYTKELYRTIAHTILNSLHYIPGWRLKIEDKLELLNIGQSFKENELRKLLR